jgi:hypothetical protein
MEPNHITAGRTALRTLLVAVVVTAAVVATGGTAAADVIDGKGNDVIDGKGNDPMVYALLDDGVTAFPIDNVTAVGSQTVSVERLSAALPALSDALLVVASASTAPVPSQDMDPY